MCTHLVRIARELPDIVGEPARLYRGDQGRPDGRAGDVANLEQGGLRGLMRVIGTEHPHLQPPRSTSTTTRSAEQVADATAGGFR